MKNRLPCRPKLKPDWWKISVSGNGIDERVPDVEVPEADSGAHGAENSIQISALAGVEPRTLASSGILASSKRALMKLNSPVINGRRGHPAQNTGNSS